MFNVKRGIWRGVLFDLWMTILVLGSWLLYILCVGWHGYFFPKETIINNDADLAELKNNLYNRYAFEVLDTVIANTECLYPITFKEGTHWLYAVDLFSAENAKCRSKSCLKDKVKTTELT